MARKFLSALAAGLLLSAAVPTLASAAAPNVGVWYRQAQAAVRYDQVTLEGPPGHEKLVLHFILWNEDSQPRSVRTLLFGKVFHPTGAQEQELIPLLDGRNASYEILQPDRYLRLTMEIPDDPAKPIFALRTIDTANYGYELYRRPVAELKRSAQVVIDGARLPTLAGKYRTSWGVLLNLESFPDRLAGNAFSVGPGPQAFTHYFTLTEPRPHDVEGTVDLVSGAKKTAWASIDLGATGRRPLRGELHTADGVGHDPFTACPVEDADQGPWNDPMLRVGRSHWARLESAKTSKAANGMTQLEARVKVWNVSGTEAMFSLNLSKGVEVQSALQVRDDSGRVTWRNEVGPCATRTITFVATGDFAQADSLIFRGGVGDRTFSEPWNIAAELARNPSTYDDSPQPAPAPTPPTSPGTGGASRPTTEGSGDGVPAALRTYSNYGIWDFRLEELKPGPDGDWQAVVRVRDAASYRVGLSTGGVLIWLFDEDGRSVASNEVNYRASVTGGASQLEAIPQTMWMEKGDEIRVRLLIRHSKGFKPVRLRLGSGDRETLSRTWPMP
jgi:hypothetical protein